MNNTPTGISTIYLLSVTYPVAANTRAVDQFQALLQGCEETMIRKNKLNNKFIELYWQIQTI